MSGQQHATAALYTGKDPVSILQEAGWAPGPVSTVGKSRPHQDSIPDRPARSSIAIPTELQKKIHIRMIKSRRRMRRSEHYNTHGREEEHTVLFDRSESHVTQWISDHR